MEQLRINKYCCKCARVSQEAIFHLWSLDKCYKVILKWEKNIKVKVKLFISSRHAEQ